jgi:hypothetical protein
MISLSTELIIVVLIMALIIGLIALISTNETFAVDQGTDTWPTGDTHIPDSLLGLDKSQISNRVVQEVPTKCFQEHGQFNYSCPSRPMPVGASEPMGNKIAHLPDSGFRYQGLEHGTSIRPLQPSYQSKCYRLVPGRYSSHIIQPGIGSLDGQMSALQESSLDQTPV